MIETFILSNERDPSFSDGRRDQSQPEVPVEDVARDSSTIALATNAWEIRIGTLRRPSIDPNTERTSGVDSLS